MNKAPSGNRETGTSRHPSFQVTATYIELLGLDPDTDDNFGVGGEMFEQFTDKLRREHVVGLPTRCFVRIKKQRSHAMAGIRA
jgi:hypothetical protein